jgi:peptidoglycan biosynthesis protein MviN/MurJ (putative lipid II flippase)
VSKRTDPSGPGLGSLGTAALTAASLVVVSGFAAVIGVIIAREFGRTDETDGFFAAYGVFVVVITAAQAIRVAVLPLLARAREESRLAGTTAGFAVALALVAVPLVLLALLAADPIGGLLTGDGSQSAQDACAEALRWIVPAAVCHLFVGLAASALAALDDYATPAIGYVVASAAGLTLIVRRVDEDGIAAVSWAMALNAAVALAIPVAVLAWRALRTSMPASATRPVGAAMHRRLGLFVAAAAIPLALQFAYVVSLPFAGRLGSGAVTSFGYAYLAATTLVAVTAFSIGLVSSVPLSRIGLDADAATRHVVAGVWVALTIIGAVVGMLAFAGADVVEAVLGDAYGDDVGAEVAGLIVLFSAWMVAAVGVNLAFPLTFVARRVHALPWIGLSAIVAQVGVAWVGSELLDLDGLALSLAVSTALVLALLLSQLGALVPAARGIVLASAVIAALTCAAFVPPGLLLGGVASALVGLGLYAVLAAVVRPRGLRSSWSYLRALR